NDSATASSVDVQLEIEASESLSGVTAYCLLIHDRIVEYVPFTWECILLNLIIAENENLKLGTHRFLACPVGGWRPLSPDRCLLERSSAHNQDSNRRRCALQPSP
ncbi:Uncharacterized protein FWK35_00014513, partial [Aphis craccivora]